MQLNAILELGASSGDGLLACLAGILGLLLLFPVVFGTGVTGREVQAAYARSSTWGVPASVLKQVLIMSTDGLEARPSLIDDESFNQDFLSDADVADHAALTPEIPTQLRYEDSDAWLAAACGSAANPTVVTTANGGTAFSHVVTLAAELTHFYTLAVDKSQYVHEVPTMKIRGFSIRVGEGGVMTCAFPVVGNTAKHDSTVNVAATVAAASAVLTGGRVLRKDGTFRMNVKSAGSLGASNVVSIAREIALTYARPMADSDHVFGQNYIIEPDDDGFAEIGLEVTYARMHTVSANSLFAGLVAGQTFKADWDFLGPYINSTTQKEIKFEFPNLQLYSFKAAVTGHQQVRPVAEYRAKYTNSPPSGMSVNNPMRLTIVNTNPNNLLA